MKVAKAKLSELREMARDEHCRDRHLITFVAETEALDDATPVVITIGNGEVGYAAFPEEKETVH